MNLQTEIQNAVNRRSAENGSDTPDFILSAFLTNCLDSFDRAVREREHWYGRMHAGVRVPTVEHIAETMRAMTSDERMSVMNQFCLYCGSIDPKCVCWHDE